MGLHATRPLTALPELPGCRSVAVASARGSLAIEGLEPSAFAESLARRVAAGTLTADDAVRQIQAHHGKVPAR